ncbi:MAG TPA: hypothetical protein VKZ58_05040 [Longimicrobiales bacterium]|nr:hypothetical protein [Longimicrobiales bacterium]
MSDAPRWVQIGSYAAPWESDVDRATLESAGIPVLVKGPEVGIFGPGFAGATSRGVTLFVPSDRLDEARQILGLDEDGEGSPTV